jgi:hypothetical protein
MHTPSSVIAANNLFLERKKPVQLCLLNNQMLSDYISQYVLHLNIHYYTEPFSLLTSDLYRFVKHSYWLLFTIMENKER